MERYSIDFIVDGKKVNTYKIQTNETKKSDVFLKILYYTGEIIIYIIVMGFTLFVVFLEAICKASKKK